MRVRTIAKLKNQHKKTALIIFAREPKDGKVKTRLCKNLPVSTVTNLYKAFVKDVLNIALKAKCNERFIFYAGNGSSMPFLRKNGNQFQLKRQTGKDLGERMYRAFARFRKSYFDRIVIIGTDCVALTTRDIETAFQKLKLYDCVLGPSKDGGYYLIALNELHRELFQGIHWGTSAVLRETLQRTRKLKKTVFLLPQREDIDRFDQLEKFSRNTKNGDTAPHTQEAIKRINTD